MKRIRSNEVADWELPAGVNRGLWDYFHSSEVARGYDESITDSTLVRIDLEFAERHFRTPGRLIDLGCGTGRLLVPFAKKGFWVLGVDMSEEMLRITGEKAAGAGADVNRVKANIVTLHGLVEKSFDYAACLFSTLGLVRGHAERRQVVENIYRLLRPGGVLVLHVHNCWFNLSDPRGRRWLVQNGVRALTNHEDFGDNSMPTHQGIAGLTLHLFTRRGVARLLRNAGFRIIEIQPVSLSSDSGLAYLWWFGWLRAYGYLIAAQRLPQE